MATPRVLILRAPGTNCDEETAFAFAAAGGKPDVVHINRLLENPALADDYQILAFPGGFSYGDDVAAGRILANQMRHHLNDTVMKFKADGKLIIGICNGFQVLVKSGALLDDTSDEAEPPATLTWNDSGRFEDRWVRLHVASNQCVFLSGIEQMYLPIAHAEGKFVTRTDHVLDHLERAGSLVLRYTNQAGDMNGMVKYPENPNGSQLNVAGVCDSTGRVFGLMPHPERHVDPTHHPNWTRQPLPEKGDGIRIFENAVNYF